jgi:hypothetical protein
MSDDVKRWGWVPVAATMVVLLSLSSVLLVMFWTREGRTLINTQSEYQISCTQEWADAFRDEIQSTRESSVDQWRSMDDLVTQYEAGTPWSNTDVQAAAGAFHDAHEKWLESIGAAPDSRASSPRPLPGLAEYCRANKPADGPAITPKVRP